MADRTCSIDDCTSPARSRGMCSKHYNRAHYAERKARAPKLGVVCVVDGCSRDLALDKATGRGMCSKHYQRWRKHGDPNYVRPTKWRVAPCEIDGCEAVQIARGWCSKHYTRWQRHGSPTARVRGEVVDGKRVCPWCGEDTPLEEFGSAYCLECQADRKLAREHARPHGQPPSGVPKRCVVCASWFYANKRRSRCCSEWCTRKDKLGADLRRAALQRMTNTGPIAERFSSTEIYHRDGWVCGICGESIDWRLAYPDVLSASIDHVIPVSKGGAHTRENVQAAHLRCNISKSNRVISA